MVTEKRRILTGKEKEQLLEKHDNCYICQNSFSGYSKDEIEFDHIYSYANHYPQELSNFAPVHASDDPRKLNCHKSKGRKSPYEYREELRIKDKLKNTHTLFNKLENFNTHTGFRNYCMHWKDGQFTSDEIQEIFNSWKGIESLLYCNSCNNYVVYDSDSQNIQCKCGALNLKEKTYYNN